MNPMTSERKDGQPCAHGIYDGLPCPYCSISDDASGGVGVKSAMDLATRLAVWAQGTHGWQARFVPSDVHSQSVAFRIGPHTGYGKTTTEAVNACADGLIEDGWPDDRPDEDDA